MPTSSASNPTPGQIAYDAFMTALALDHPTPWHRQDVRHHAAWEAAAQAAIAQWWRAHETVICGEKEEFLTLDLDG